MTFQDAVDLIPCRLSAGVVDVVAVVLRSPLACLERRRGGLLAPSGGRAFRGQPVERHPLAQERHGGRPGRGQTAGRRSALASRRGACRRDPEPLRGAADDLPIGTESRAGRARHHDERERPVPFLQASRHHA